MEKLIHCISRSGKTDRELATGGLSEYKHRRNNDFACPAPDGDFNVDHDYQNALEVYQRRNRNCQTGKLT